MKRPLHLIGKRQIDSHKENIVIVSVGAESIPQQPGEIFVSGHNACHPLNKPRTH